MKRTWLTTLPITLPIGVGIFGVVAVLYLILDAFYFWPIAVSACLGTVLVLRLLHGALAEISLTNQKKLRIDKFILLGVILWIACNTPFAAQHLRTDRDPATYAVAAVWLTDHTNLHISTPKLAESVRGAVTDSLGFENSRINKQEVHAQGMHLLPALLGFIGKIIGKVNLLYLNVVLGGITLLAFYGFAREILKQNWAAFATAILALSLPMIYFSRDTYTEPLTLMAVFSAFALIHIARKTDRSIVWIVAGVMAGVAILSRIDMYPFLIGMIGYLFLLLMTEPVATYRRLNTQALLFIAPVAILCVLAWYDFSQLSSVYYHSKREEYFLEIITTNSVVMIGILAVWIARKTSLFRTFAVSKKRETLAKAITAIIIAVFVVLLIRALHLFILAVTGKADTMSVRDYAKGTTVLWLLWYISPIVAISGMLGLAFQWRNLIRNPRQPFTLLILALSISAALYIWHPRITPDHVWASRRFLPLIFPGFILLAVWLLQRSVRRKFSMINKYHLSSQKLIISFAILSCGWVVFTSAPFLTTKSHTQLSQVQAICNHVPKDALILWVGSEGRFLMQPVHAYCGVQSFRVHVSHLQQVTENVEHTRQLVFVGINDNGLGKLSQSQRSVMQQVSKLTYVEPEHTYKKFPTKTVKMTTKVYIGPLLR